MVRGAAQFHGWFRGGHRLTRVAIQAATLVSSFRATHGDPSEVINRLTAPDTYTPASTIQGTPIVRILLDVANAAIFWQLMRSAGGLVTGDWEAVETYMLPGSRQLVRPGVVGIRFRAAIPAAQIPSTGFQAVVTVEAVK